MTIDQLLKMEQTCKKIQEDCQKDAYSLDGLPFTGATMAPRLGEIYAVMEALAAMIGILVDEKMKEVMNER